uniref:Solute carrier family 27 member 6 n=1 Tax=Rousettus aegyptiacus TaxID=9407 RepID=A0A7J8F3K2_ROUAE|nr:solute carrier family 27 member 6 [Rousettus aegyptiacus]
MQPPCHLKPQFLSLYFYLWNNRSTKSSCDESNQGFKGFCCSEGFGCTADDIIYITLPLYHSSGSHLGIGATCVLKKKFSASKFWNDCKKHNVSLFQYIGELYRYLCKQPKKEGKKIISQKNKFLLQREPGLLISQVRAKNPFFGYAGNKKNTEKKLLCDVFKKGDVYFNPGDLMVQDQEDFLYLGDHIGDNFRELWIHVQL